MTPHELVLKKVARCRHTNTWANQICLLLALLLSMLLIFLFCFHHSIYLIVDIFAKLQLNWMGNCLMFKQSDPLWTPVNVIETDSGLM